jgi:hypothetical protein
MCVHLGARTMSCRLPEPAYGLSRYRFDDLLWRSAIAGGATAERDLTGGQPTVFATGRTRGRQSKGERLFGFKAHFDGPARDSVELFFFGRCYVGLNAIEGGATNVCGLGPESVIRERGFDIDALLNTSEPLRARLAPLRRSMEWLHCGPLEFRQSWDRTDAYVAGDALSFVDPFTGSGLLSAVVSGSLAGEHAARGVPVAAHLRVCRTLLHKPFALAGVLRSAAATPWAELLAPVLPGRLLYHLTRPSGF